MIAQKVHGRRLAAALVGTVFLAACAAQDRVAPSQLTSVSGGSLNTVTDPVGNVSVCKVGGPSGTYKFNVSVDQQTGGSYSLPNGPVVTLNYQGVATCAIAYQATDATSWDPQDVSAVTITEQMPLGMRVQSIFVLNQATQAFQLINGNPTATVTTGWNGRFRVNYTNEAIPTPTTCEDPNALNYHGALPCVFPPATCEDPAATNFHKGLPCVYPPAVCEDPAATNYHQSLPCQYPPEPVCEDQNALNYHGALPCQYPPQPLCEDTNALNYHGALPCQYPPPDAVCAQIRGIVGNAIAPVTLEGRGGTGGPYTFSATGLPAGLTMASDGTISGTPTASGDYSMTVTITDKDGNVGTKTCLSNVQDRPWSSCTIITAVAGQAISKQFTAAGGAGEPYTFSAVGLPPGLTMSSTGLVTGTATASGVFNYTVTVTDKDGNVGTTNCGVSVDPKPTASCVAITAWKGVAITPKTLVGSGGTGGPYTFSATGLPAGLTMSSNGTISGTPTVGGTFTYTVTVTDKDGNVGTFNCTITVNVDNTAPVCSVVGNASPPYMTFQDNGVGIVKLEVTVNLNNNYKVGITPFPTGTIITPAVGAQPVLMKAGTVITFPSPVTAQIKTTATRISTSLGAQLTIRATNALGQTVTCDPIETTITRMKQDKGIQTFYDVPYEEYMVTVTNGGLRAVWVDVNGTVFKIQRLSDTEVRTISIQSAMKPGDTNTIKLIPKGKKGEEADVYIGPPGSNN